MIKKIVILTSFLFCLLVFIGHSIAAEKNIVTYKKDIEKIISNRCLLCHGSDSPTIEEFDKDKEGFKKKMKGPRMNTYKNLMIFVNGSDTGAIMRRLDDGKNTKDSKPGNMYQYLGSTDTERAKNLEVFKKWVGGWSLKRKAEITEDELKAIKALEK